MGAAVGPVTSPTWTAGGNIDVDPLFVDPDGPDDEIGTPDDNLCLQSGSPVNDKGHNDYLPADILGLDGTATRMRSCR